MWKTAPDGRRRLGRRDCRLDKGSRSEHTGVKSRLFITQDLVKGTTCASGLGGPIDQCGCQIANLIMDVGHNLLTVGVTDGYGTNTRANHPQGRLVKVGHQHVVGLASTECPEQPEGHGVVPPV